MWIKELGDLAKKVRPRANMVDPSTGQAIVSLEKERREKRAFFEGFEKNATPVDAVRSIIRKYPIRSVLGTSFVSTVVGGNRLQREHKRKRRAQWSEAHHEGFMRGVSHASRTPEEIAQDEAMVNKYAASTSLIGTMKGLQPGVPKYEQGGDLNRAPTGPNPGVAVAPKSDMPPLPTMVKQKANRNLDAALPFKRAKIPKPPNK